MMDKPVIHATINHGGLAQNLEILVETQNYKPPETIKTVDFLVLFRRPALSNAL